MKKNFKKSNTSNFWIIAIFAVAIYLLIANIIIPAFNFIYEKALSFSVVLWSGALWLIEILWTIFIVGASIISLLYILYVIYFFFRQKEWQKTKDEYLYLKEKILSNVISNKKSIFDKFFAEVKVCTPPSFRENFVVELDKNSEGVSLSEDSIIITLHWKCILNDLQHIPDAKKTIEYMKIIKNGNEEIDQLLEEKIEKFFPVYKNVFCSTNKDLTPAPRYVHMFEEARGDMFNALLAEPLNASLKYQIELIKSHSDFNDRNDLRNCYKHRAKAIELLGSDPTILQDRLREYQTVLLSENHTTEEKFREYINKINEIPKEIQAHLKNALGVGQSPET